MCSVGFPGILFCTLQNKPQPGISVFKKEKKSRNEFTDCKLLWGFFLKYIFIYKVQSLGCVMLDDSSVKSEIL